MDSLIPTVPVEQIPRERRIEALEAEIDRLRGKLSNLGEQILKNQEATCFCGNCITARRVAQRITKILSGEEL